MESTLILDFCPLTNIANCITIAKLNSTKIEDILKIYKYFKKVNQKHHGKVFSNVINCLATAFSLPKTIIRKLINNKGLLSTHEGNTNQLDNFDKEIIRRVVHNFYEENIMPTSAKIQKRL